MLIMSENTRQRGRNKDTEVESGDSAVMEELKALNAKMDRMQATMDKQEKQQNKKIDSLKGTLEKLISDSQATFKKALESAVKEMNTNLDLEVGIMCARMEKIEQRIESGAGATTPSKRFDPDVSLIIAGLPQSDGEDLAALVTDLLHTGLECDPIPELVAVERIRARGSQPGLVKVELLSTLEKVDVLRRKSKLKNNDAFEKVYVSSAKSHTERLLDLNFRALLREIPAGKKFYVAANGRMVKRAPRTP